MTLCSAISPIFNRFSKIISAELDVNTILYKRVREQQFGETSSMRDLEWFSLEEGYGSAESYGSIVKKYRTTKKLTLLDIGHGITRENIEKELLLTSPNSPISTLSNPDNQYSGTAQNRKYHLLVKSYFSGKFDGTIIDENLLVAGNRYTEDDLAGPSEIVLWKRNNEPLCVANLQDPFVIVSEEPIHYADDSSNIAVIQFPEQLQPHNNKKIKIIPRCQLTPEQLTSVRKTKDAANTREKIPRSQMTPEQLALVRQIDAEVKKTCLLYTS